jgi:hypothetical protein
MQLVTLSRAVQRLNFDLLKVGTIVGTSLSFP